MSDESHGEPTQDKQDVADMQEDKKGAAVKFPPPAIFACAILLGACLQYLWPAGLGIPEFAEIFGYLLVLFGITIAILVATSFRRAGTAIEPWKPTTSIVTTGLYAWSRNPIYAGFCLISMGVGVASNSLWIFISFIPAAFLLYHVAIAKEEAYLEEKFGEEYTDYKKKVRRWI
ncbi:MAG: isoprenylcysteine carboxylmethyltransferase family protein [Gammaproteobacteria bacterium]|nr:isoprenylcysteine carboxylmethyltransferase family protein [Gammaproteobacteria bacterium]